MRATMTVRLRVMAAGEPVPLDVGLAFNNIAAVPLWLGVDRHLFERYGVQANLVTIRGGSQAMAAMLYALGLLHVDPKRVIWLQIDTETDRLPALRAKQIQFTILIVGMDAPALAAGFRPMLKMYETKQPFQHATVAVYKPWAETHKTELRNFLKGLIAGIVYWKNPDFYDNRYVESLQAENFAATVGR